MPLETPAEEETEKRREELVASIITKNKNTHEKIQRTIRRLMFEIQETVLVAMIVRFNEPLNRPAEGHLAAVRALKEVVELEERVIRALDPPTEDASDLEEPATAEVVTDVQEEGEGNMELQIDEIIKILEDSKNLTGAKFKNAWQSLTRRFQEAGETVEVGGEQVELNASALREIGRPPNAISRLYVATPEALKKPKARNLVEWVLQQAKRLKENQL